MKYIESSDRRQLNMLPECLDDYIESNNEVKIIEAFVEKMSENKGLEQMGFNRSGELSSTQGRPQYSCEILLKLYIYGYLHHIRSSRKLEWLSRTNIELKWLLGNLYPDHKTISDFRRVNKKGIKSFFKMLLLFLRDNDLVDGKLVAYDGCKMKANTAKGMYSINKLEKRLKEIEKEIDDYLDSVEKTDQKESKEKLNVISTEEVNERVLKLKKRMKEYTEIRSEMDRRGKKYMGKRDKECSLMKSLDGKIPAYNFEAGVDNKNKFIILSEVTASEVDNGQLNTMIDKTKENGIEIEMAAADSGFYTMEEVLRAEEKVDVYVAMGSSTEEKAKGFKYDKEKDEYICPEGKPLRLFNKAEKRGKEYKRYRCSNSESCKRKTECTTSAKGRHLNRYIEEEKIEKYRQKINGENGKEILKKRKTIIEHVFGTMKLILGKIPLLTRGLENVDNELKLISTTYNIRRLLNILSFDEIMIRLNNWNFRLS